MLFAPAAARRDGWAMKLALELVSAWGDAGQKVVLADGMLEYPMLHRELGLQNTEGIADAALFGASVARVARPVPGRAFFFVSAGSPTGNPEAIATSPRWGRLVEGFRDAGVTLVLFLREGCAAEEALAASADDVVVLAGSAEDLPEGARRVADRVRIVVGPRTTPAEAAEDPAVPGFAAAEPNPDEMDDAPDVNGFAPDPFESIPSQESLAADMAPTVVDPGHSGASSENVTADLIPIETTETTENADLSGAPHTEAHDDAERPFRVDAPEEPDVPVGTTADALEAPADGADQPEPLTVAYTPTRSRRHGSGADPDARKKLLWVVLTVVVLAALVILGALRPG